MVEVVCNVQAKQTSMPRLKPRWLISLLTLIYQQGGLSCIILICKCVILRLAVFKSRFVTAWKEYCDFNQGIFLDSRCSGWCLCKLFSLLLFLPLQWIHKWRVIVLFSRSLLNVSPTQIFGQSQEERDLSGASWGRKMLVVLKRWRNFMHDVCEYNFRGNHGMTRADTK